jgi:hypothetical protein
MSDRPARVRLMLDSGSFIGGLQSVAQQSESIGKRIGKGLGGWGIAGLERFGGTLKRMGEQAMTAAKWGLSLGGAFTVGGAIKSAVELTDTYRNLAFAVEAGTGQSTRWQQIQADIEGTAGRWSKANADVAASFKAIWDDTGDLEFTSAAVESAGKASRATGKDMGVLAGLAGTLFGKFGVGAKDIDASMAALIELGNKGGISLDEMSTTLGVVGASARQMGKSGAEGVRFAMGMFNLADAATGNMKKATAATAGLMDELGNTDKLKQIQKELRIKLVTNKGDIAPDALEKILARTGGRKELLAKVFSGESLKLISELGKPFEVAYKQAKDAGESTKGATAKGLEAYRKALEEAGRVTMTAADVERKAKERLSDPSARIQDAMNRLTTAFTQPEMISAIEQLAGQLPRLAQGLADLIRFTTREPWAAASIAIPAVIAKEFAAAGIGMAVKSTLERSIASATGGIGAAGLAITVGTASFMITKAVIEAHYAEKAEKERKKAVADAQAGATLANARAELARTGTLSPETREKVKAALKNEEELSKGVRPTEPERQTSAWLSPTGKPVTVTMPGRKKGQQSQTAEAAYETAGELRGQLLGEGWEPESVLAERRARQEETFGFAPEPQQSRGEALTTSQEMRMEAKAAARAQRDLAEATTRAARELDRLRAPPGEPPAGAPRGGPNGLPPLAPRSPGYTPR